MATLVSSSSGAAISEVTQLRNQILAALDQRGRHYSHFITFTVRFHMDDTHADRDSSNFQTILRLLGLPVARELVILADDKTPGWTYITWMATVLKRPQGQTGRTLILGHYAGHGFVDVNDQLNLHASPQHPAGMTFPNTLGSLFQPGQTPVETDICMILDCCYSGLATRGTDTGDWSGELVASVGPDQKALGNWSYLTRLQNKTFTSRIADEVAREVGRGATSINLAAIIATLRQHSNPEIIPIYHLKSGNHGIRIPHLKNIPYPPTNAQ